MDNNHTSYQVKYSFQKEHCQEFRIAKILAKVPNLPPEFNGYKIVQLTDLHYGPITPRKHIEDAVRLTNSFEPDLIALTGDNVQLSPKGFRHFFLRYVLKSGRPWRRYRKEVRAWAKDLNAIMSKLEAKDGVVSVLGNHEYHEGRQTIVHALNAFDKWLINSSFTIERNKHILKITGLDDSRYGRPDIHQALQTTYKQKNNCLSANTEKREPFFKIILVHNPDVLLEQHHYFHKDSYMIFAGHTHGGQIRLPGLGPIITRTKQRKFVRGFVPYGLSAVYINSGVGWGGIKLRLFCPPEIAVLELQPK